MSIHEIKQHVRHWLAEQTQLMEQAAANVGFYGSNPRTSENSIYKAFIEGVGKDKELADVLSRRSCD